jgi:DGQHR domain-containing protein
MTFYRFKAIRAKQAPHHDVCMFAADPHTVLAFSEIERVARKDDGQLQGFQRHQISSHIKDIRDYMAREDALLPNAVIVAFIEGHGARIVSEHEGVLDIEVNVSEGHKPGFVVDGQQRLTALSGLDKPGFEVFVSALICKDYNELRQQFVLINNTRPLPKTLIYELLPEVEGLPERFTARKFAARIVDRLNFAADSSLQRQIRQHTNNQGVLSDVAMQKVVMNSASDGALRDFIQYENREEHAYKLVSEFFAAVEDVFGPEWVGMTPRQSRLVHGAGLVAMGFVMDHLYYAEGALHSSQFRPGLEALKPYTAWTSGQWPLTESDVRPWNGIQNTPSDIDALTRYLVASIKKALRKTRRAVNE